MTTATPKVTIYSTPTCHFCHDAKEYFTTNHVPYTEYNVASDLPRRQEMIQKSGQMGVPVIDVDGEIIVGFDQDRIKTLLKI